MATADFSRIDHLIFGVPELQTGINLIQKKLGVSPSSGGKHPKFGTHNALFKISDHTYFEVIAPDPDSAHDHQKLWMGLDQLSGPALIWWAAKADDLESASGKAKKNGWDLGQSMAGSRNTADGRTLSWKLTDPYAIHENGVLPFLIDWGNSVHPTVNMPDKHCRLIDFQLLHPAPEKINTCLRAINLSFPVAFHSKPMIRAGFSTIQGTVYL